MASIVPRSCKEWRVVYAAQPARNRVFKIGKAAKAYADQIRVEAGLISSEVRVSEHRRQVWLVRIRCKGVPPLSKTFDRQADAKDWAKKKEGEIASRQFVDHRLADKTTLADVLGRYDRDHLSHRPAGYPDRTRLRMLCRQPIAQIALSVLQPSDFAAYRQDRLKTVKGSTVRKDLELFTRVIGLARKEWSIHLPQNPASGQLVARPEPQPGDERDRRLAEVHTATPAPLEPGVRTKSRGSASGSTEARATAPWTIEPWVVQWMQRPQTEEQAVLRACRYPHWFQPKKRTVAASTLRDRAWRSKVKCPVKARLRSTIRLWALASLSLHTGLRRGELLKLQWDHVHLQDGYLYLPGTITKSQKSRIVPLTLRARRIVCTQPRVDDRVFPYSPSAVSQAWDRARQRAGSRDLRMHDLRHEATSRLFEQTTLRDTEIGSITGHSDPRMLQRYYNKRPKEFVERFHASFRPRTSVVADKVSAHRAAPGEAESVDRALLAIVNAE